MTARRTLAGYLWAVGAVAVATAAIAALSADIRIANVSILYLPAVLLVAARAGRGPAIFASLASFLTYDMLFVEPRFHLTVAEPSDWISLLLLLLAAGITGQMAADQRSRAREAERREREATLLYDVTRLMGEPDPRAALPRVAERIRHELGLTAVAIDLSGADAVVAGDPGALDLRRGESAASAVVPGRAATASDRGGPARRVRIVPPRAGRPSRHGPAGVPIVVRGLRRGTLLAIAPGEHPPAADDDRVLVAVAAQIAGAMERDTLRREAAENEVLRRADELKSALLGAVSHDLRTPLASIIASTSTLRQDVQWSGPQREELLGGVEEQARRLDRLVGNLLDLSRIEAGALTPEKGWYDAGALVDDVLGRLRAVTDGHSVRVRVAEDLPPVHLDYVEIDQTLSNLVENAARHAPPGSEIEVEVRTDGDAVRFAVRDHGAGVPADTEAELFSPFPVAGRADRRGSRVGLGLAVARRLVEAHGGRIWYERPPEGGARFVFSLPLEAAI